MRRLLLLGVVTFSFLIWVYIYQDINSFVSYNSVYVNYNQTAAPPINDGKYLVSSPKCKIVDLEPFNKYAKKYHKPEKYTACRKLELLTYVTKTDGVATLHVDDEIVPSYLRKKSSGISCCYSDVHRHSTVKDPDNNVRISECKKFTKSTTIKGDIALVRCTDLSTKKQVYENVHSIINPKNVHLRNTTDNTTKPISVLIVGIDSISRLNFIRSLPITYKYVTDNDWATLKGYNKMDDNTFPNLMAILTGYNQSRAYSLCNPKEVGHLDKCPMLWYNFRKLGYVTGYAEDDAKIGTFNFGKKGFRKPPTDYYLRPYVMAAEKLKTVRKDGMTYCAGPETSGERILNAAKDFAITFKDVPLFGLFWMNSFSHNAINSPTGMDNKIKQFLEDLSNSGVLDSVVVIFLSDHGIRFGDIRLTPTGWLEERLPFIYVSFPGWFKVTFKQQYDNFLENENRLTSPYDLYVTLQHLMSLSGFNVTIKGSEACPLCQSLFNPVEEDRSCEEAGIDQHWCTCYGYKEVDLDKTVANKLANFVIKRIDKIIRKRHGDKKCANYKLHKIINTSMSEKLSYNNNTFIMVKIETKPKAIFETTVLFRGSLDKADFYSDSSISRLDWYNGHSSCVDDTYLKKYCFCK
ncbi:uncharacterized protein LOC109595976 isoform X2 [Aethina tumida]|nr:uncharacterized protein LOC109595976 isoform X2 [Aethina tumida]